jgi:hypothetical protein
MAGHAIQVCLAGETRHGMGGQDSSGQGHEDNRDPPPDLVNFFHACSFCY